MRAGSTIRQDGTLTGYRSAAECYRSANTTYLPTSITSVWTDPTDTDFNRVMVYLDGAWKTDPTEGVQLYDASGLTADTQHIIGTRTVDTIGNINLTWVNHTARTAPLPDTAAPRRLPGW